MQSKVSIERLVKRPSFLRVHMHYPPISIDQPALLTMIGWVKEINKPTYANTCALRLGIGFLGAGYTRVPGRIKILSGVHTGKLIEPGQAKLTNHLVDLWGPPDNIYKSEGDAKAGIGNRRGVVSFF